MTLAVSYLRFSSSKQRLGTSEERQEELLIKYLKKNPHISLHSKSFKDLGLSAYHSKQMEGDLGAFLEAVQKGEFPEGTLLIVEAIDRLGRSEASEMLNVLTGIIRAGIEIVTLEDNMTYNRESLNGGGIYILVGKVQAAHQYSERLSTRIIASWDSKRKKAKEHGIRPIFSHPFWLDKKGDLKEEYQPLLERMFKDYLSGLGQTLIAERLRGDSSGLLPKINAKTVKKTLANPLVIGLWEGAEVYPVAIPKTLFYRVQGELTKRSKKPKVEPRSLFFSGIAKCECGSNLSFPTDYQKGYTSSRCNTRSRKKEACGNNRSIAYKVFEYVHEQNSFHWEWMLRQHRQDNNDEAELQALDGEIALVKSKLKNIEKALERVVTDGLLDSLESFQKDLDSLEGKRLLLEGGSSFTVDFITDEEEPLLADEELLRASLIKCGYKIVCDSKGIVTVYTNFCGTDGIESTYKVLKGFKKNGAAAYKTRIEDTWSRACFWL
ncbi:recombinase family protein [Pseudoalteromonas sp. T1lg22]|uniref:recombinase family protein n=1 Tax=Pseudoalteromonas sp. T1lg22 TaxID=2077096 RepID=UPI000CF72FE0|nr:recombinase family protein [Pseudoalteromonas sp. T1lg22]